MGLPHVVVRFYTNPDGRAARRTTLVVLGLLSCFYVLPPVYATLGRLYAPDLIDSGRADAVVLELPGRMVPGLGGDLLTALVVGGAFAAFLSTSSGLTVAVAGVLSQDVFSRRLPSIPAFRVAAVAAVLVPLVLALLLRDISLARTVGLAFAVSASTFCPLLVLGIWWRGLTPPGALAAFVLLHASVVGFFLVRGLGRTRSVLRHGVVPVVGALVLVLVLVNATHLALVVGAVWLLVGVALALLTRPDTAPVAA